MSEIKRWRAAGPDVPRRVTGDPVETVEVVTYADHAAALDAARAERDFLLRVFRLGGFDDHPELWWRTDGEYAPVTIFINCNDVFWWAVADLEQLTPENIGVWEQAYADLDALVPEPQRGDYDRLMHRFNVIANVNTLFCARVRGMRPQGCVYPNAAREVWPLFDACGPEREIDAGNPYRPGERPAAPAPRKEPAPTTEGDRDGE